MHHSGSCEFGHPVLWRVHASPFLCSVRNRGSILAQRVLQKLWSEAEKTEFMKAAFMNGSCLLREHARDILRGESL